MGGLIELLVIVGVVIVILALVFGGRRRGGWRLFEFVLGLIGALVGMAIWSGLIGTPRIHVPFTVLGRALTLPAHPGLRIGAWLNSLHLPSLSAWSAVPVAARVVIALLVALILIVVLLRVISGLAMVAVGAVAGLVIAFVLLHVNSSRIPELRGWVPWRQINHLLPSLPRSLRFGG